MGLPRYLAAARADDLERTLWLADDLNAPHERSTVALLQCGRESPLAGKLGTLLRNAGRTPVPLVVRERSHAQSPDLLRKLTNAGAVWVFAEDMFETFVTVFATQVAFVLRSKASEGLPVIGIGGGAMALGGLVLANRICDHAQYELVTGLGWAPRVMLDAGADPGIEDGAIARDTVRSLPGLLGLDLGVGGAVRVEGGRLESVGDEPIELLGASEDGRLLVMALDPGQVTTIAPPPFAPFHRGLLPQKTVSALSVDTRPQSPRVVQPVPAPPPPDDARSHTLPGSGRVCPMCNKVHSPTARVELAA